MESPCKIWSWQERGAIEETLYGLYPIRSDNEMEQNDIFYMRKAMELAKKGRGYTSPNPMVGCVIVKEGNIIGMGYHEKYGQLHAERNALKACQEEPAGATLYVTLEPCCHYGKTPPCTEAILEHHIKKVVIGCVDRNPLVGGKGVKILEEHGVEVVTGVLEEECRKLNEVFFHFISEKTPFLAIKYAMTLDGKIATNCGDSKWITNEKSRQHVHFLRKYYTGIMVGIQTVFADNPMLNCRIEEGVNPIRLVCDSKLQIPLECALVKTAKQIRTIVIGCTKNIKKIEQLQEQGVEIILQEGQQQVNLQALMVTLGEMGIDSILLEGGGTMHAAALEAGIVQKVYAYIAPKLIGGKEALSPIAGNGISKMQNAVVLEEVELESFEGDFLISGNVKKQ